jgi:manganese/iron transport system permease protein
MVQAMWVSSVIGIVCALLSCFIVLKGWSLMGDALSHAIIPGVVVAHLAGIPLSLGAFISGFLASHVMSFLNRKTLLKEDAIIGIVFTSFFALGVLLLSLFPSNLSLKTIVFGNILGISPGDILHILVISAITFLVLILKWKDFMTVLFDAYHAKSVGLNPNRYHTALLLLLSVTAVSALQTAGVCLVVAMLITPGATAYLLTNRFKTMMVLACGIGGLSSLLGAYFSYFFNGSTGGCIVVLQTALFFSVLALTTWRKKTRAS